MLLEAKVFEGWTSMGSRVIRSAI